MRWDSNTGREVRIGGRLSSNRPPYFSLGSDSYSDRKRCFQYGGISSQISKNKENKKVKTYLPAHGRQRCPFWSMLERDREENMIK